MRFAFAWFLVCGLAIGCGDDGGTASAGGSMDGSSADDGGDGSGTSMTNSGGSMSGGASGSGSGTAGPTSSSGNGSSSESGATDTAACAGRMDSCAMGEMCCEALTCCAGIPVPVGSEFCDMDCPQSDVNLKHNFSTVDVQQVLDRVAQLPISTWNYRADDATVRHLGPMAQDFRAQFGLGATDRRIHTVDSSGVALAAIQALHARLQDAEARNAALNAALAAMQARLDAVEAKIASNPE